MTNTNANNRMNMATSATETVVGRLIRIVAIPVLVVTNLLAVAPASATPCDDDPIFAEANGCRPIDAVIVSQRVESTTPFNVR